MMVTLLSRFCQIWKQGDQLRVILRRPVDSTFFPSFPFCCDEKLLLIVHRSSYGHAHWCAVFTRQDGIELKLWEHLILQYMLQHLRQTCSNCMK